MKQVILDTNLLVLFVIGMTDINLIEKHKRTQIFDVDDFELLKNTISKFDQIVVTPQILTETSNLLSQADTSTKSAILNTYALLLELQKEEYMTSISIVKHESFTRFGLTDCGILLMLDQERTLITTDAKLYYEAAKLSNNAVNFNDFRRWN